MLVLIPAYKPDFSLVNLVQQLGESAADQGETLRILVVDDGSGASYTSVFDALTRVPTAPGKPSLIRRFENPGLHSLTLVRKDTNGGKGAALRAGLSWAAQHAPAETVVTADADGQHLPADILAVGRAAEAAASTGTRSLVLGVRTLADPTAPTDRAPLRSRLGNSLTALLFRLSTGVPLADTQTGLRGFPPEVRDWALTIPGERYDYEFNMLLRASRFGVGFIAEPITKVYEAGNPTSHFAPVRDSVRIYAPLLLFLLASFAGFLIDTVALFVLVAVGLPVVPAVVLARLVSALSNFALNRVIMHDGAPRPATKTSLARYALLATGVLVANAGLMELLTLAGLPLILSKILVEALLVPLSFALQRRWVFAGASSLGTRGLSTPGSPRELDSETEALTAA